VGAIDKLEDFASTFGARFYELPLNTGRIKLMRKGKPIPAEYGYSGGAIVPFRAGQTLEWSVEA
jgi:dihydroorotase